MLVVAMMVPVLAALWPKRQLPKPTAPATAQAAVMATMAMTPCLAMAQGLITHSITAMK